MRFHNRYHKNVSMTSTNHLSHNSTYFYSTQPHSKVLNCYAHIRMPKEDPQWHHSATTLRHTSHKYSFSKDSRFKDNDCQYSSILKPEIPSTLCSKSCTLGKGKKKPISEVVLRNAEEKPGPDRYDLSQISEITRSKSKGRTFGLSWKHYKRTFIKHRKDTYAEFHFQNKPAAIYHVREKPGQKKLKFTSYGRLQMFTERMAEEKSGVPGPHYVVNDRHLFGMVGLNCRNMGFGNRIDLSKPANQNPGAKYELGGFCDKFANIRHKKQKVRLNKTWYEC